MHAIVGNAQIAECERCRVRAGRGERYRTSNRGSGRVANYMVPVQDGAAAVALAAVGTGAILSAGQPQYGHTAQAGAVPPVRM
jgi:hypothetical protein